MPLPPPPSTRKCSYEGEAVIYGHDEVIALLREMAMQLLNKKETVYIGDRLHLVEVNDGDTKEIMGKKVTFFDTGSTKTKQFGFCMDMLVPLDIPHLVLTSAKKSV